MNTPPARPPRSSLHDLTTKPPPLYNSCSSASTTMLRLLPAVIVLRFCCRSFVDCGFCNHQRHCAPSTTNRPPCLFSRRCPPPLCHCPPPPPPRPTSCQPSSSSAFAAAHLLNVVFCNCRQCRCGPFATSRPPCLFSRRRPPPHPSLSTTSSYRRP